MFAGENEICINFFILLFACSVSSVEYVALVVIIFFVTGRVDDEKARQRGVFGRLD